VVVHGRSFLVGGAICLVNSINERDLSLLTSYAEVPLRGQLPLTDQIWLHLHTPKYIICVGKFEIDDVLYVGKKYDGWW